MHFNINTTKISASIAKAVPHIFTGAGILWFGIGVVGTFNLGRKAASEWNDMDEKKAKDILIKDVLPVAGALAIGTSCVITSDICNTKMLRATEHAYNNVVKNYQEYKAAVIGALGAEANKIAMKASVEDKRPEPDEPPLPPNTFHFYDEYSRNDFVAELADVIAAEYDFNHLFQIEGCVAINKFYDMLNLPHIERGDEKMFDCGEIADWSGCVWIDFMNVEHVEDDGTKWYSIHMNPYPTIDGILDWDSYVNESKVLGAMFNH